MEHEKRLDCRIRPRRLASYHCAAELRPAALFLLILALGACCDDSYPVDLPEPVVTVDVTLGAHVHLNVAVTVGHDAQVGDFCTLSSHVDICGGATLGEGVFLGSHASVMPKAKVGEWARVGAGSGVLRTVRAKTTVFGVPAVRVAT